MKSLASIIIVVKDDPGIKRTLELINAQQGSIPHEVIVIDASEPDRLRDIRDQFPLVRWEQFDQQGKRFTITEQRNRGLELAKGEFIVFIDANCEPEPNWLKALMQALQDGEDIVCGPCRPSNSKNLVQYIEDHAKRTYMQECTTINVALRRKIVDDVGQFDTGLSYGEDVDYFWRARDKGYKICYEPKAAISHDYGDAGEQFQRAYRYGKSRAVLHKKHWRTRLGQLLRDEPHVWIYPLFILSLPLAILWPPYLLVLLIPLIKNRSVGVIVHHLVFGWGVIVGALFSF